jgi:hypothetical protein
MTAKMIAAHDRSLFADIIRSSAPICSGQYLVKIRPALSANHATAHGLSHGRLRQESRLFLVSGDYWARHGTSHALQAMGVRARATKVAPNIVRRSNADGRSPLLAGPDPSHFGQSEAS